MPRDLLLLLEPGFTDPAHPGERFICPDGAPIEGLLAGDPTTLQRAQLDVRRLPFARPRQQVVALLGEQHQGLPVLILDGDIPADAQRAGDRHFVTDTRRILDLLAQRHGFPRVH